MAVVCAVACAVSAAPAAAAGRCGDPAERPWCDTQLSPDLRAELLLAALTQDEKISLLAGDELTGVTGGEGQHTGTSNGVPRVGLPPIYFSDGPVGTRQGKATGMPSPISLAASFSSASAFRHATIVGDEVKRKGNDVVYAPAMNMQRTPLNGRTFEYFGEDPVLAARMAVAWTKGVQEQGVIANAKHFAVNNQEGRSPVQFVVSPGEGSRFTVDARLDERTLREIYLPQFEAAVKEGGVGSVMCAYPRVNGQYACENSHLLEDILKGEWNFSGFVLTDYGANKSTVNSLNNGLDLDIWPGILLQPPLVQATLATSQVSSATIDEHVRRQLRTLFAFGFFDREDYVDDTSSIDRDAHHAVAAEVEQEGIVLLRNEGGLLPLDPAGLRRLALVGPEADELRDGGGSSAIDEFQTTTPREAIEARLGADRVAFADGSDTEEAVAAARDSDVAVVVVGDRMTEGADKPCMGLNCNQQDGIDRDALIDAVAAAQPNTIVLLQTGGPVLTPWRERPRAILEAWYPGQNGGTAMARVLFGDAEPGGRLPTTFPLREADQPTSGDPEAYPGVAETVRYKEGVLIGYRWFDERRLGVAYPFGFGLTYTTFDFRGLRLGSSSRADAKASVVVRNTGTRTGTAVPQLYVGMPEPRPGVVQPPFQLKGFRKLTLAPGEARRVTLTLDERDFSYWAGSDWEVAAGCYRIGVGSSSRDLPLQAIAGRGRECDGALQLPRTSGSCTSRRALTIPLPRAIRRRARVRYAGRAAEVVRRGRRLAARIDLRRLRGRRVTIRITGSSSSGQLVRQTRVVRACARRS